MRVLTIRRAKDILVAGLLMVAVAVAAAWFARNAEIEVAGMTHVIDGDSVIVNRQEVRLRGIDAPELGQNCDIAGKSRPCGQSAKRYLQQLVAGKSISCVGWEEDRYQRLLAVCQVGDLVLNEAMVLSGNAVSYGDYQRAEATARDRKVGVWAGDFTIPSNWRREQAMEPGFIEWLGHKLGF